MRTVRVALLLSCVLALAGSAVAQPAAVSAVAQVATGKSVLQHVPDSALGVAVVNNVGKLGKSIDAYITDIGMGELMKEQMPEGVLAAAQKGIGLGDGFDPNGGVAVFLLNPKDFGMDLMTAFGMGEAPKDAEGNPVKPIPPVVLLVPGKSAATVFPNFNPTPAGKYTKITMDKEVFCLQVGSYVAISPLAKALDAVAASQKSILTTFTPLQAKVILGGGAAMHLNMKALGPDLMQMLKMAQAMALMNTPEGPEAEIVKAMFGMIQNMLKELDGLTVAARIGQAGAVLEGVVAFRTGSPYGHYFQAPPAGQNILSKVPSLPYVLALGTAKVDPDAQKQVQANAVGILDKILKQLPADKIPAEKQAKIKALLIGLGEQVTSAQVVAGGPADDAGLFGLSIVLGCKSDAAFKKLLADMIDTCMGMIPDLVADPDAKKLTIQYQAGVETVGDTKVDAITIDHPELANLSEEDRGEMTKALGEDKIRLLVASADAKTVVITFGGGMKMMTKALATAKGGTGKALAGAGELVAMKEMPRQPAYLILLNAGNLMDVVIAGAKKISPDAAEQIPFKITCKTPVAIGLGQEKGAWHASLFVPNKLVQEVVTTVMTMMSGPRGGPDGPPPARVPGGNDF